MIDQLEENLPAKNTISRGSKLTNEVSSKSDITEKSEENLLAKQGTGGDLEQQKTSHNESKEELPTEHETEGDNQEQIKTYTGNGSEEDVPVQHEVSGKPNKNVQAQEEISKKLETGVQLRLDPKDEVKVILQEAQVPSTEAKKTSQEEVCNITS
ncbi:hypothetical protein M758_6G031800 [Ceratodon purpureus]|nr:hypothetical protein M758_6G031800 [Ceratodon purpureus]